MRREILLPSSSNPVSEHGRSRLDLTCPFCKATVTAYLWSLAGSGKKCICGALHTFHGTVKYFEDENDILKNYR